MRVPSFPNLVRTFYTVSNATTRLVPSHPNALAPLYSKTASLRGSSMGIPILSSLFSTAPTRNMTHPVQKSDSEWQAVLNPGMCITCPSDGLEGIVQPVYGFQIDGTELTTAV